MKKQPSRNGCGCTTSGCEPEPSFTIHDKSSRLSRRQFIKRSGQISLGVALAAGLSRDLEADIVIDNSSGKAVCCLSEEVTKNGAVISQGGIDWPDFENDLKADMPVPPGVNPWNNSRPMWTIHSLIFNNMEAFEEALEALPAENWTPKGSATLEASPVAGKCKMTNPNIEFDHTVNGNFNLEMTLVIQKYNGDQLTFNKFVTANYTISASSTGAAFFGDSPPGMPTETYDCVTKPKLIDLVTESCVAEGTVGARVKYTLDVDIVDFYGPPNVSFHLSAKVHHTPANPRTIATAAFRHEESCNQNP